PAYVRTPTCRRASLSLPRSIHNRGIRQVTKRRGRPTPIICRKRRIRRRWRPRFELPTEELVARQTQRNRLGVDTLNRHVAESTNENVCQDRHLPSRDITISQDAESAFTPAVPMPSLPGSPTMPR